MAIERAQQLRDASAMVANAKRDIDLAEAALNKHAAPMAESGQRALKQKRAWLAEQRNVLDRLNARAAGR